MLRRRHILDLFQKVSPHEHTPDHFRYIGQTIRVHRVRVVLADIILRTWTYTAELWQYCADLPKEDLTRQNGARSDIHLIVFTGFVHKTAGFSMVIGLRSAESIHHHIFPPATSISKLSATFESNLLKPLVSTDLTCATRLRIRQRDQGRAPSSYLEWRRVLFSCWTFTDLLERDITPRPCRSPQGVHENCQQRRPLSSSKFFN